MTQPPGPYGPPPTPNPYGQAPGPARYPQAPGPYAPAPGTYAPPAAPYVPPKKHTGLVIGGIAAFLVLGLVVVWLVFYKLLAPTPIPAASPLFPTQTSSAATPKPSRAPSSVVATTGFTLTGTTLSGPTFTATVPTGYTLAPTNGGDNSGTIINGPSVIWYYTPTQNTAANRCATRMTTARDELDGTLTNLPSVSWAGTPAVAMMLSAKSPNTQPRYMFSYCVDRPNSEAARITAATSSANPDEVRAAAESLLASWTWI